jgi:NAD(P)-dependent dehydrogenase (short-subunit alcohol dehydrogenase family)
MFEPDDTHDNGPLSTACRRCAGLLDDALEVSVVGSFSSIGFATRRRLWRWNEPGPATLAGRTVAVTGPTSGLGRAAAFELARLGARVVLVGRDATKLDELRAALTEATGADRYPTVVADLASIDAARDAARRISASEARLDVLVDNAGAMFPTRRETPDGLEATFALLVVGPFVLETGLLPLLRATPGSRVIAVTSGGMYAQRLPLDDLQLRRGEYSGARAYARAKRAQVALMREWARRLRGEVAFAAMHPGWADTPGLAEALPGFRRVMRPILRTPVEGIDTLAWLAAHPDPAAISGRLYLDRRARPFDRVPATRLSAGERSRLWDHVAGLAGEVPDRTTA